MPTQPGLVPDELLLFPPCLSFEPSKLVLSPVSPKEGWRVGGLFCLVGSLATHALPPPQEMAGLTACLWWQFFLPVTCRL